MTRDNKDILDELFLELNLTSHDVETSYGGLLEKIINYLFTAVKVERVMPSPVPRYTIPFYKDFIPNYNKTFPLEDIAKYEEVIFKWRDYFFPKYKDLYKQLWTLYDTKLSDLTQARKLGIPIPELMNRRMQIAGVIAFNLLKEQKQKDKQTGKQILQ